MLVSAIDPGTVNGAAWIGRYDRTQATVTTLAVRLGISGLPVAGGAVVRRAGAKMPAYESAAALAVWACDQCAAHGVERMMIETAPIFNTTARICAAASYGVAIGSGVRKVCYSSSHSKKRAILAFAEATGLAETLEQQEADIDRADKRQAERARKVNKRNAVTVVRAMLTKSNDAAGLAALEAAAKKDDIADAILLACALAL